MEVQLGSRKVNIRRWKVKDRKAIKALYREDITEEKALKKLVEILVFNCIEEKIDLNHDEIKYLLAKIREYSLNKKISYSFNCSECNEMNKIELSADEIFKPKFGEIKNIKNIELQDVKNPKLFNQVLMDSDEPLLDNLMLRIKTINGEVFNYEKIKDYFNEMDTLELDEILDEFEKMIFTLDSTIEVTCKCGDKQTIEFDNIPDLIPIDWITR